MATERRPASAMSGMIDQHSPPSHNKRMRPRDALADDPTPVPITPSSPLPNEESKVKGDVDDVMQSMSDCVDWSPLPFASDLDDNDSSQFMAALLHENDDNDSQFMTAPLQENVSRQRAGGTDDTIDTCTVGDQQQQRVEALRFLYKNPLTKRGKAAVHNEQHSNLKKDDETSNPSNNPLIGSILNYMKVKHEEGQDWQLACKLQQDFFESLDADSSMKCTIAGRAFQFVERVLMLHQQQVLAAASVAATANPQQHEQIEMVAIDDMYFMAERMLQQQAEFRQLGKPIHVDIGYHYTHVQNMDNIRTNGLLSRAEQYESGITATGLHGMVHGDGIYTGNNPHVFAQYGTIGILVARLKGQTCHSRLLDPNCDTVETVRGNLSHQIVVLKSSSQCIPLVHFPRQLIQRTMAAPLLSITQKHEQAIAGFHNGLQNIIDEFFNNGHPTTPVPLAVSNPVPISTTWNGVPKSPGCAMVCTGRIGRAKAWSSRRFVQPEVIQPEVHHYAAPDSLKTCIPTDACRDVVIDHSKSAMVGDCPVCLDSLCNSGKVSYLEVCQHKFHYACIQKALETTPHCPVCRKFVYEPIGRMPSGTMTIRREPHKTCEGFKPGVMQLAYNFDRGIQKIYHENPGSSYQATTRMAYLPDNAQGHALLKRLKYAFCHGLTFTIGTSLTTNHKNVITWASIQHKTTLVGGMVHGYPDEGYFYNCNKELDALHVPAAADLP